MIYVFTVINYHSFFLSVVVNIKSRVFHIAFPIGEGGPLAVDEVRGGKLARYAEAPPRNFAHFLHSGVMC